MEIYHTIAPAVRQIPTANKPLQILCDHPSLTLWIVKASQGQTPSYRLAKELMSYRFGQIWGLNQPLAILVSVNLEHIAHLEVDPLIYSIPCFGSQFRPHRIDWDKFMELATPAFIKKFSGFRDILKIALFDLWLGNEDRFAGNHNMLIESRSDEFHVMPIDHEAVLNATDSNHNVIYPDSEMMLPHEDYSLLTSSSIEHVLKSFKEKEAYCNLLIDEFPALVEACKTTLKLVFDEIPEEWGIDKKEIYEYLFRELFNKVWIERVSEQFTILASRLK